MDSNNIDRCRVLMEYLLEDKYFNIFIIGDILKFGLTSQFHDTWCEFDGENKCNAVLLRFYNYYILYAHDEFNAKGFAGIINSDQNALSLSGKTSVIKRIEAFIHNYKIFESSYAKLESLNSATALSPSKVENAYDKDVEEINLFRNSIPEFSKTPFLPEPFRKVIGSNAGKCYLIRKNDQIVSMAASRIETNDTAVIGSICTLAEYRNLGLATTCTYELCNTLLNEGKEVCLFYSTDNAGAIYKKLGFEDIGFWTMMILK